MVESTQSTLRTYSIQVAKAAQNKRLQEDKYSTNYLQYSPISKGTTLHVEKTCT